MAYIPFPMFPGRLIVPEAFAECLTYEQQVLWLARAIQRARSLAADATVDGTAGNPTVTVTETVEDGVPHLVFNFSGLKGEKGEPGEAQAPNIGMTVTVDDTTGTPTATVTVAGAGTMNPQYEIALTGIKGEPSDPPEITLDVEVDGTTGTPTATVTQSGTPDRPVYLIDFSGLKGEKGDTGADGQPGQQGPKGDPGEGVPAGGTAGQVLTKTADGTAWETPTGGSVPAVSDTDHAGYVPTVVSPGGPVVWELPIPGSDAEANVGKAPILSTAGTATAAPEYRWEVAMKAPAGAENSPMTLPDVTDADGGKVVAIALNYISGVPYTEYEYKRVNDLLPENLSTIPTPTGGDEGKVLGVGSDGMWALQTSGGGGGGIPEGGSAGNVLTQTTDGPAWLPPSGVRGLEWFVVDIGTAKEGTLSALQYRNPVLLVLIVMSENGISVEGTAVIPYSEAILWLGSTAYFGETTPLGVHIVINRKTRAWTRSGDMARKAQIAILSKT